MARKSTKPTKSMLVPYPIIGALAEAFKKSLPTIQRWIDNDHDLLTSDKAKKVFAAYGFTWESRQELDEVATVA